MDTDAGRQRIILRRIARRAMIARGLLPDFSLAAQAELGTIHGPATADGEATRDLRQLLWCSIDNDDSRDLDQLTVAEASPGDRVKIFVAVADVDAVVHSGMAIDVHARNNTTSIYTAGAIFPMLPEKLSTGITSLNPDEDRLAIVIEMTVAADGTLADSVIYRATSAKSGEAGLQQRRRMARRRRQNSGLRRGPPRARRESPYPKPRGEKPESVSTEPRGVGSGNARGPADLRRECNPPSGNGEKKPGQGTHRRFHDRRERCDRPIPESQEVSFPAARGSLPRRWDRIVEVAISTGSNLPPEPDPKPLADFLAGRKAADPLRFPDLSLTIIKLMGSGEYVPEFPEKPPRRPFRPRGGTIPIPRPPTADIPISSPNGCSRHPSWARRYRMAATN